MVGLLEAPPYRRDEEDDGQREHEGEDGINVARHDLVRDVLVLEL